MHKEDHLRRQMIIALHETPGIGWMTIKRAVDTGLWRQRSLSREKLLAVGFKPNQANLLTERMSAREFDFADYSTHVTDISDIIVLTRYDESYPQWLQEIAQPPWVLYLKGRMELLKRPSLSIVGTREPTAGGRSFTEKLSEQLSFYGVTIVSGLARGIDSKAHEAALRGKGSTIAVLPTPINSCYPPENRNLFRRIGEDGLLLTETPPGTKLHPGQFPQRNRIIAGLSQGTIVIEGAAKSGSLITAGQALEMNREIFAVPGSPSSPKSEGPNGLIKRGEAKLITCVNDIVEELPWLPEAIEQCLGDAGSEQSDRINQTSQLTPEELSIIRLLQDQPLSINEIHELSRIPFGHLNALLLNLCIKRKIGLQPGALYIVL